MNRRSILLGLGAALAAPAIIRTPGLLMPVRRIESAVAWCGLDPAAPAGSIQVVCFRERTVIPYDMRPIPQIAYDGDVGSFMSLGDGRWMGLSLAHFGGGGLIASASATLPMRDLGDIFSRAIGPRRPALVAPRSALAASALPSLPVHVLGP